jgi:hemerythrin-like metal-binding protein
METNQTEQTAVSPYAAGLHWSADLHTGDGRMDHTHEEFVTLLNALLLTPQTDQLNLYREFLNHTVEHFAQEDRWMLATGFTADNCHAGQHATILETMRAVETHYVQGDPEIISRLG